MGLQKVKKIGLSKALMVIFIHTCHCMSQNSLRWITQTLIEAVCDLVGLSIAHVMIQISIVGILKKPGFFKWWVFMTACSIAAAFSPYALRVDCFMCKLNGQGLSYETASDDLCMKGEL